MQATGTIKNTISPILGIILSKPLSSKNYKLNNGLILSFIRNATNFVLLKHDNENNSVESIQECNFDQLSGLVELTHYFEATNQIILHSREHILEFQLEGLETGSTPSIKMIKYLKIELDPMSLYSCNLVYQEDLDTFLRFRLNPDGHRHYIVESYNRELNLVSSEHCGNVWHYEQLPVETLWNKTAKRIYHPSKIKVKEFKEGDDINSDCGVRVADLKPEIADGKTIYKVELNPQYLLATSTTCFNIICDELFVEVNPVTSTVSVYDADFNLVKKSVTSNLGGVGYDWKFNSYYCQKKKVVVFIDKLQSEIKLLKLDDLSVDFIDFGTSGEEQEGKNIDGLFKILDYSN